MKAPIVISFDLWNTLIRHNPRFKEEQAKYVEKIFNLPAEKFLARRVEVKATIDKAVRDYGLQFDRIKLYADILQTTRFSAIENLISESDELFWKYPPQIINTPPGGIVESTICSNTNFIHSDVLKKFVKSEFGITTGNYSDMIGFSKPNDRMFQFLSQKIQPQFHVGDDMFTDSACKKVGIQFIHISDYGEFKKTIKYL